MEKKELQKELKMVSSISKALELRKIYNDNEKVLDGISKAISKEKDEETKLAMIAAASKSLDISERNPHMKDKEIIKRVIKELSSINREISKHKLEKSKN